MHCTMYTAYTCGGISKEYGLYLHLYKYTFTTAIIIRFKILKSIDILYIHSTIYNIHEQCTCTCFKNNIYLYTYFALYWNYFDGGCWPVVGYHFMFPADDIAKNAHFVVIFLFIQLYDFVVIS